MHKTKLETYESPLIEVISIEVERGFACSNEISGWEEGGSYEDSFDI